MTHPKPLLALIVTAAAVFAAGSARAPASTGPSLLLVVADAPTFTKSTAEVVDASGTTTKRLPVGGENPVWAPDGSRVAWLASDGIRIETLDGKIVRARLADPTSGFNLVWSPDSRHILISTEGGGELRLVVIAIPSLQQHVIRQLRWTGNGRTGAYVPLAWSADGSTIAYTLEQDGPPFDCCHKEIDIANPDGSGAHRIYTIRDPIHDGPLVSLSPNGRYVAFADDGKDDPPLVVLATSDGHSVGEKTSGWRPCCGTPAWAPNSSRFAYPTFAKRTGFTVATAHTATFRFVTGGFVTSVVWSGPDIYVLMGKNRARSPSHGTVAHPSAESSRPPPASRFRRSSSCDRALPTTPRRPRPAFPCGDSGLVRRFECRSAGPAFRSVS